MTRAAASSCNSGPLKVQLFLTFASYLQTMPRVPSANMIPKIDSIPEWYNKGMRFYPTWSKEDTNQLAGLVHLILDVATSGESLENWLEVGSHIGESATVFLAFPFVRKLHCVDIVDSPIFRLRLSMQLDEGRCEFHHSSSAALAKQFDSELDVVYIDGDHAYASVIDDIESWYPKLRCKGFLCGHDYRPPREKATFPGVVEAVEEFSARRDLPVKRYCDGSWMMQKP
jgi:hypothetical protein